MAELSNLEKLSAFALGGCIGLVAGIPLLAYDLAVTGFVFMKVWNWFVPAVIVGAPVLGFVQGVGLRIVGKAFAGNRVPRPDPEISEEKMTSHAIKALLSFLLGPWFMLLVAYLIKTFML